MQRLVALCLLCLAAACEQHDDAPSAPSPGVTVPATAAADLDAAVPAGSDADTAPTTTETPPVVPGAVPAGWTGTGVLARSKAELPASAPAWAGVEAEVVEREGKRVLQVTGHVQGIGNPALAQITAENRARAGLARWLKTTTLQGSRIVGTFQDGSTGTVFARAEVDLPEDALR